MLLRLLVFALLLLSWNARAQNQPQPREYLLQQAGSAIRLDGIPDEEAWKNAISTENFQQHFPFDSALANTRTVVKMLYDDQFIYVSAVCYHQPEGDHVVSSLRRDFAYSRNDAFALYLDPLNDKTNGYCFALNPYGAQMEGLIQTGGGFGTSPEWDQVWYSEVKRYPDHWTLEMAIPFRSLRYKQTVSRWGLNFSRNNLRQNEGSVWNPVPRNFNVASIAFCGTLQWAGDIPAPGFNLALVPYGITQAYRNVADNQKTDVTPGVGLDARVSIRSSLNLDLTFNPDFAQVDVDRQITNLTRFSLFFPEQRAFFQENSDLFARFGFSKIRPFFSRRIGLFNGETVPILAGARLSGKVNETLRIGMMTVQTGEKTVNTASGPLKLAAQNHAVLAFQQDVFRNGSNIAFIMVNRDRTGGSDASEAFNRIVGVDYNLATRNNRWRGKFFYHQALRPVNQPDQYAHASWLNYSRPEWNIDWNHEYVGENYLADNGFVPRLFNFDQTSGREIRMAYWRLEPSITRRFYPRSKIVNNFGFGVYWNAYFRNGFQLNENQLQGNSFINFQNTATLRIEFNERKTGLLFPFNITGRQLLPLPVGDYFYRDMGFSYSSDVRKRFTWYLSGNTGTFYNGHKNSVAMGAAYRLQPWAVLSADFNSDEVNLPETYGRSLLQLIGPRAEITFNRSLFWTTFVQYNTQTQRMNIYTRLQWRFRPMSDLFIVYSDNSTTQPLTLLNQAFAVKLVYWLGV